MHQTLSHIFVENNYNGRKMQNVLIFPQTPTAQVIPQICGVNTNQHSGSILLENLK